MTLENNFHTGNNQRFRYMRSTRMAEHRARPGDHFTLEQVAQLAPTVFAEHAHDSRSERYTFISTRDICRGLYNEGFLPVAVNVAKVRDETREGAQKHLLRFARAEDLAKSMGDRQEIALLNAHDGSAAYALMNGIFRMICMNGTIAGDMFSTFKVQHKGGGATLDAVVSAAHEATAQGRDVARTVANWKTLDLSRDEFHALAESAALLRFDVESAAQLPARVEAITTPRRIEDTGTDLWTRFNVVQEHIIKGGVSTQTRNAKGQLRHGTARPVNGIDQNTALNRAMWNLAQRMAELKKAA